jgi:beta-phosphoglucomutase-like phosphatase (HAD superfamily)
VFDLDGVLTMSAEAHAAAWTQVFDAFLGDHAQRHHRPFFAFDPRHDYEELVAGRPRRDGIRVFLASRGVNLPE